MEHRKISIDTDVHQIPVIDGSLVTYRSADSAQQPIDRRYQRYLGLRSGLPPGEGRRQSVSPPWPALGVDVSAARIYYYSEANGHVYELAWIGRGVFSDLTAVTRVAPLLH